MEVDGRVVVNETQLRGRQGRLVFAYLVCERTRPVPKEELATIVWPHELSPSWEGALSALTSRLGAVIATGPLKSLDVVFSRSLGQYQVYLPADAWIDIEAGASAIDRAEALMRAGKPEQVHGPATAAAAIARRPFLPGIEGFWVDSLRERLKRQLLRALDCLAESQILLGEPSAAVETATEAMLTEWRPTSVSERTRRLAARASSATDAKAPPPGMGVAASRKALATWPAICGSPTTMESRPAATRHR